MNEELKAKFDAASSALFELEKALGPLGSDDRVKIFALRCKLAELDYSIKQRPLEQEAIEQDICKEP